ncbi:MFS transporter [Lusitaniella coriacea LEGE 07157]|uniref:MFS transporter n=1 Tax=Lusitaniella coriacea LEGE 07157 TaxID=945747 RepID=A0A8J7JCW4_9CYAN|nr:MFS transporter [Lusitaniella coriacea]MBE9117720.1 MFS transporter [Lusitaniella coriacea LEGE 07157]
MRTVLTLWIGQLVSIIGSEMTNFAIALWAWKLTGQATPLSLMFFFTRTPTALAAIFAGVIVDRCNRKQLMILGDTVAGLSTLILFSLLLSQNLAIWHLYLAAAVNSLFGYFQHLAYSASLSSLVAETHYTRVAAMGSLKEAGAYIAAPALAGLLYPQIGLEGILIIDLITFFVAIATLAPQIIPQPQFSRNAHPENWYSALTFGFRYLLKHPPLLALLLFLLGSNFFDSVVLGILPALILSRSDSNATLFASIQMAFGIGGLTGAIAIGLWGGFKRRIHGVLIGSLCGKISLMLLGLGRSPSVWIAAAVAGGFFIPLTLSSNQGIWFSKVETEVQGRVFATRYLIAQMGAPLAFAIAGPLADRVFEPAMSANGQFSQIFKGIFGSNPGAGIALQCTLFSILGLCFVLAASTIPLLRENDKSL